MNTLPKYTLILTSLAMLLLLALAPIALAQGPYTITIGEIDAGATLTVNGTPVSATDTFPFAEGTTVTFTTTYDGESYEDVIELHYDIEVKVHAQTYTTHPGATINLDTDLGYSPYDIFVITSADNTAFVFDMATPPSDAPVQIIGFHAMVPNATINALGSTSHSGTPAEFAEIFYGTVENAGKLNIKTTCSATMGSSFNKIAANNVLFGTNCGEYIDIMIQELYANYAESADTEISWWRMELTDQFYVDDYDGYSLNDELPEQTSLDNDGMLWFKARNPAKWALYPLTKIDGAPASSWQFDNYHYDDYNFWETHLSNQFYWYNDDDGNEYAHFLGPVMEMDSFDWTYYANTLYLNFFGDNTSNNNNADRFNGDSGSAGTDFWSPLLTAAYGYTNAGGNIVSPVFVLKLRDGDFHTEDYDEDNYTDLYLADNQDLLILSDSDYLEFGFRDGSNFEQGTNSHWVVEDGLTYKRSTPTDEAFSITLSEFVLDSGGVLTVTATNGYKSGSDTDSTMYLAYRQVDDYGKQLTKVPLSYSGGNWSLTTALSATTEYDFYVVATENDDVFGKVVEITGPFAFNDVITTTEEVAVTISPLTNDYTPGNPLTISNVTAPVNGTATISGTTQVVYTPTLNFAGTDVFSYTVSDGTSTDIATISVTVNNVNDEPRIIGGWGPVGDFGFTSVADYYQSYYPSLALDGNNLPYVVYVDKDNDDKASVMKYNGSSWSQVGNPGFTSQTAYYPSLALDSNNRPWVAYGNQANVIKYNGSSWEQVGTTNFGSQFAYRHSLVLDSSNTPYVAYHANDNSWPGPKVEVMKYNGSSWDQLGAFGPLSVGTYYPSLTLDSNNTPYVAFYGQVMKYSGTGTDWQQLGNNGDVGAKASLALDSSNTPYAAYIKSGKVSVKKFNGTSWEYVGNADFSADGASYVELAFDSADTPYVAYNDGTHNDKATVMQFNGEQWNPVSHEGFSFGTAGSSISLAIHANGTPYVAYYDDDEQDNKLNVMSYDKIDLTVAQVTMDEDGVPTPFYLFPNVDDPDEGDTVTWSLRTPAISGTATVDGTGIKPTLTYTTPQDWFGTDSFVIEVTDGVLSDTVTVNVTVNNVNDAPDAVDDLTSTDANTQLTISPLENDTDADNDTLSITAVTDPANGGTTISGTTQIVYTPATDFAGREVFSYTISDSVLTDTAVITVDVAVCLPSATSGNWSDVVAACATTAPGKKILIPAGYNITLDQNINLDVDLEIESGATFDTTTNRATVTLTGSGNQTLTGDFTFYRLTVQKDTTSDTVTIDGSLEVTSKLRIRTGELVSASQYQDVDIEADGTLSLTKVISVSGHFTNSGTLTTNGWGIVFNGATEQNLVLNAATSFDDITVLTDTTLIEANSNDNVSGVGVITNYGTIRKTQAVDAADFYYFGLAGIYPDINGWGMEIEITDLSGGDPLTEIQVDRLDKAHPNGASGSGEAIYWTITPTGADFIANVTLPHNNLPTPLACRYSSGIWDCANDDSDVDYVTYGNASAFSDWAVFSCIPTMTVQNSNDSGAGSLRQAVTNVCPGSTVDFDASLNGSTITLASEIEIIKALTIDGPGRDVLTVSGGGTNRIFNISDAVTIDGLTLRDGYTSGNGGAIKTTAALTLTGMAVISNSANTTGGAMDVAGSLVISGTKFISNNALSNDGAFYAASDVTISGDSLFERNVAQNGYGGAFWADGAATITATQFISNSADNGNWGGAFGSDSNVSITDSLFRSNRINGEGGAFHAWNGAATISNTDFISNTAGQYGAFYANGNVSIVDSLFERNLAQDQSEGAFGSGGTATITNTDFISNTADYRHGAFSAGGNVTISDSLFRGNVAKTNNNGAFYTDGSVTITNTQFISNTAYRYQGGFYATGDVDISNSLFQGNVAQTFSAGALYAAGTATITNTTFIGNSAADYGGALYLEGGGTLDRVVLRANQVGGVGFGAAIYGEDNLTVVNSLLTNNGGDAAVISFNSGSSILNLIHTTIASATLGSNSAIEVKAGTANITNSIIANYSTGINNSGTVNEDYNLFAGNTATGVTPNTHSISDTFAAADFVDAAGGDFHIGGGSLALDSGVDAGIAIDYDGDTRPWGKGFDMGYDETPPPPDVALIKTVLPTTAKPGDSITYTLRFSNTGSLTATGVVINDSVPMTVTNPTVAGNSGANISLTGAAPNFAWQVADLSQNQGGVITLTGVLTEPLAAGYLFTNTATITATDDRSAANNSSQAGLTVQNAAPDALDDPDESTKEDTPLTISPLTNDSDPNGDTLKISLLGSPSHGTAVISGTTQVVYTPTTNYVGTDSFLYTASDGNGLTDFGAITVTVKAVNDAPVITNSRPVSVTMSEDGSPKAFDLTLTANDPDSSDVLTWTVVTQAISGTATASGNGITKTIGYTPDANWHGSDNFTVQVSDGTVSDTISVSVTVESVNDAPVAVGDNAMVRRDDNGELSILTAMPAITIPVLANDSDQADGVNDSSGLTISAVGIGSQSGAVAIHSNSLWVEYTPTAAFTGTEVFTYTARDSGGLEDTATVTVTVVNGDGGGSTQPGDSGGETIVIPATGISGTITVTVQIPAGVATDTYALVYNKLDAPSGQAPDGYVPGGIYFKLDAYLNQALQPGYVFTPPLTMTFEYSDADVASIPGGENSLTLFYWDSNGNEWLDDGITIVERDTANNRLIVSIAHLTEYALFGRDVTPIYLPLIVKGYTSAPDLVITELAATGSRVTVRLKNQGNAPVSDDFWVDVYFNPSQTPGLNQPWNSIAPAGAVWAVTDLIAAGDSLTLTVGDAYYVPQYSSSSFPLGAQVYGYVDSVDHTTSTGAVYESNESNNLFGPVTSGTGSGSALVSSQGHNPDLAGLPQR